MNHITRYMSGLLLMFVSSVIYADNAIILKGDINNDKKVDVYDVKQMADIIKKNEYSKTADLNNDGKVTIVDLVQLVDILRELEEQYGPGNEVGEGSGAAKRILGK